MKPADIAGVWSRVFLLALCAFREAAGESYRGKLLVCQTIENRVNSAAWPQTYEAVILQPWQFSSFNKNDPNATKFPKSFDNPVWRDCFRAAMEVLMTDQDLAKGANHYWANWIDPPKWHDENAVVEREGRHVFLKL